jgi:periplasmic divalent cation tolerance protein
MRTHEPIIVMVSFPDRELAIQISHQLLENKLVACAQLSPIESHYKWHGTLESSNEYMASFKTVKALWKKTEQAILLAHPYEVPEILAIPMMEISQAYFHWMLEELGLSGQQIHV